MCKIQCKIQNSKEHLQSMQITFMERKVDKKKKVVVRYMLKKKLKTEKKFK